MPGRTPATPQRYRVINHRLRYPADPAITARLLKGEAIPEADIPWRLAYAGDVVDDIPESSVAALLRQGDIEATDDALTAPAGGD